MTDYRSQFITWYFNEFRHTAMFEQMSMTVENSPWHREQNVGVHTDMVVAQYLSTNFSDWTKQELLGAFACAFHDVGKPPAEEIITRDDGSDYRRYAGHEKVSAREWENWACTNWVLLVEKFDFVPKDIWATGWVIEHHLPYGVKKPEKVEMMLKTASATVGLGVFFTVLRSDCWGRISDGHEQKKADVESFIEKMEDIWSEKELCWANEDVSKAEKVVYMLIGPSHVGKSTFKRNNLVNVPNTFSWDQLRLEWYDPDYRIAFEKSSADNNFKNKALKRYNEMLSTGESVVVDNTNLSAKIRRNFVVDAKRKGYKVAAILFPIARDVLFGRVGQRLEQEVPLHAVRIHYDVLQMPFAGEFDAITVSSVNLPTT